MSIPFDRTKDEDDNLKNMINECERVCCEYGIDSADKLKEILGFSQIMSLLFKHGIIEVK